MYKRLFSLLFYFLVSLTHAVTISETEFDELRKQIHQVVSQSPALAITKTDDLIAQYADRLTVAQKIRLLYGKAWFQIQTDDFNNAFQTLADCKHLSAQTDQPNILFSYYSITASAFSRLLMYEKALENFMLSYEIAGKMDTEQYLRQTENNIGDVHLKLGRFKEARQYFERFYEHAKRTNLLSAEATGLNNIGETYYGEGDYQTALSYHLRSLKIRDNNNFTYHSSWSHHNLGRTYINIGDFDKAEYHLKRAIEVRIQVNAEADSLEPKVDLVRLRIAQNKADNAEQLLKEIVTLSDKYRRLQEKSKALELLRDLYRQQGNLELALDVVNDYIKTHFELLKKQAEVGVTYYVVQMDLAVKEKDLAEREQDIAKLQELNELQKANAEAVQAQLTILIVSSATIAIIIAYFALRLRSKKQKLSDTLAHLKETQNQLLEAQKMSAMTTLVSGMAHQLNTPLGLVVTSSSILEEKITNVRQKLNDKSLGAKELEKFLDDAEETLALTSRNSNRAADMISRFKMISASLDSSEASQFNILSYLQENCQLILQTLPIKLSLIVQGDNPLVYSHPEVLLKVISQLLDNSCTHGFNDVAMPSANITVSHKDKKLLVTYSDNGSGISQDKVQQVFDPFYTSQLGQGKLGLGLNIVYNSVVHVLKGNVECKVVERGACFIITLPLSLKDESVV